MVSSTDLTVTATGGVPARAVSAARRAVSRFVPRAGRAALSVVEAAARCVDALPVAPAQLADRAVSSVFDRRVAAAERDPRWAAIEARRETGQPGKLLLSDDLTLADWELQRRIEEELVPDPWWWPVAVRARRWHAAAAVDRCRYRAQRARRGWSDRDAYDVARHLAAVAAGMLEHLADTTVGWPCNDRYRTPEDWQRALRTHAQALAAYVHDPEDDVLLDTWGAVAVDPDGDADALDAARSAWAARAEARAEAAAAAMHWIADNFDLLWD